MKKLIYSSFVLSLFLLQIQTKAQNPGDSALWGCTDTSAINWDPLAIYDDGSCYYVTDSNGTGLIYGCTDPLALNYNPMANIDDGSCFYPNDSNLVDVYGCTDPMALNYNPFATIEDGSCLYDDSTLVDVYGCMDPMAINYNPFATIDDGSCEYQNDTSFFDIYGCMDPIAINYNPLATIDDGSCIYDIDTLIYGCTDPMALNYNPLANFDDGSCFYENDSTAFDVYGCMDPMAINFNPLATIDDGSCIYSQDSLFCEAYFYVANIDEANGVVTVVNLSIGSDNLSYYWTFGDGNISTEAFPTYTYEEEGIYALCLTIADSTPADVCVSTYCDSIGIALFGFISNGFTINIIPESAVGIVEDVENINAVNVYPNPASNILNVSYDLRNEELLNLSVYDLSGRLILNRKESGSTGKNLIEIDINRLPPGSYQLELSNNNMRSVKRFQVIK